MEFYKSYSHFITKAMGFDSDQKHIEDSPDIKGRRCGGVDLPVTGVIIDGNLSDSEVKMSLMKHLMTTSTTPKPHTNHSKPHTNHTKPHTNHTKPHTNHTEVPCDILVRFDHLELIEEEEEREQNLSLDSLDCDSLEEGELDGGSPNDSLEDGEDSLEEGEIVLPEGVRVGGGPGVDRVLRWFNIEEDGPDTQPTKVCRLTRVSCFYIRYYRRLHFLFLFQSVHMP